MEGAVVVVVVLAFNVFRRVSSRDDGEGVERLVKEVSDAVDLVGGMEREKVGLVVKGQWTGASPWMVAKAGGVLEHLLEKLRAAVLRYRGVQVLNLKDAIQCFRRRGETAEEIEKVFLESHTIRETLVQLLGVENIDAVLEVGTFWRLNVISLVVIGSWDDENQEFIRVTISEKLNRVSTEVAPVVKTIRLELVEWSGEYPEIRNFKRTEMWKAEMREELFVIYKRVR
jgi:hypothetical protein